MSKLTKYVAKEALNDARLIMNGVIIPDGQDSPIFDVSNEMIRIRFESLIEKLVALAEE